MIKVSFDKLVCKKRIVLENRTYKHPQGFWDVFGEKGQFNFSHGSSSPRAF